MNISNCNFTTYTSPDPKQTKQVVDGLRQCVEANVVIAQLIAEVGKQPTVFNAAPQINLENV